jgi:signal transduction histidine kinase
MALRRALLILAALGLVSGVIVTLVILSSDHENHRGAALASTLVIGWAFIGAGLFAWWRRPESSIGSLMVLTGFFWFFNGLITSDLPAVFAAGYLFSSLSYGFLIHMLLAFPDGRLETRLERAVVIGAYVDVTVLQMPQGLVVDTANLSGCDGCPPNPLLIHSYPGLFDAMNGLQALVAIVVIGGLVVALVRRWRRWTVARRRAFAPVLLAGGATLALTAGQLAAGTAGNDSVQTAFFIASLVPLALIPFTFLAGVLASRVSRAGAVSDLVAGLSDHQGDAGLRDALAEALADPSLELVYWAVETGGYVDRNGHPRELPGPQSARLATVVEHNGAPVGAIIHAGTLDDATEMVETVAGAAGLGLENERLNAELLARLEELKASRARIVAAGYEERRRVERDLHDGAQQRLVSLALTLRLARSKLDDDPAGAAQLLAASSDELEGATAELRELARGIHPAILTDRGLATALEALVNRAPLPVELDAELTRRPAPDIEAALYYVVSEALTNVTRHAAASRATVGLAEVGDQLVAEISDDGRGGADPSGSGLRGLADRVAALDGALSVENRASGGTVVRARIPLG